MQLLLSSTIYASGQPYISASPSSMSSSRLRQVLKILHILRDRYAVSTDIAAQVNMIKGGITKIWRCYVIQSYDIPSHTAEGNVMLSWYRDRNERLHNKDNAYFKSLHWSAVQYIDTVWGARSRKWREVCDSHRICLPGDISCQSAHDSMITEGKAAYANHLD